MTGASGAGERAGYTLAWDGIEAFDPPPVPGQRSREEFAIECIRCGRRGIAHDLHDDPDHGESIRPALERPCPVCRAAEGGSDGE
jgi:hypothetical protein